MKIKQVLIIIFALIIASFIGYRIGINRTGSFTDVLESTQEHHSPPPVVIEPGSGVETASYIIFKDDEGFVYAKSGDTGEIEFSGTDAAIVINNALNALTSGRTWKETVFLKGNFSLTKTGGEQCLTIPSYTILKIDGQLIYDEVPVGKVFLISNSAHGAGNTNIDIIGGRWNGNYPDTNCAEGGIYFNNVQNFSITQTEIVNTDGTGIYLRKCSDGTIIENTLDNLGVDTTGGAAIGLTGTNRTDVSHNRITNSAGGIYLGAEDASGFRYCQYNRIVANHIENVNRDAISLYPSQSVNCYVRFNVVSGNTLIDCSGDGQHAGVKVGHHVGDAHVEENDIIGNVITFHMHSTTAGGIAVFPDACRNNIVGNTFHMRTDSSGIVIASGADDNIIKSNYISNAYSAIRIHGNTTLVEGNYLYQSDKWAIQINTGGGGNNFITGNYISGVAVDNPIEIRNSGCTGNVIFGNYIYDSTAATEINDVGGWVDNNKTYNYEDEDGWVV